MKSIVTDKIKLQKVVTDLPKNKSEEDVISAALFTALKKEKGLPLLMEEKGLSLEGLEEVVNRTKNNINTINEEVDSLLED